MARLTIDLFAETLVKEPRWYTLGIFLGTSTHELDDISRRYSSEGMMRCLIELYKCMESNGKELSWERIVEVLRRIGNHCLADSIHSTYISPSLPPIIDSLQISGKVTQPGIECPDNTIADLGENATEKFDVPIELVREFDNLSLMFTKLTRNIRHAIKKTNVCLDDLQDLMREECSLEPLSGEEATVDNVLNRLPEYYSLLNVRILKFLVETLLDEEDPLQAQLSTYTGLVDNFKTSAMMRYLVDLLKEQQTTSNGHKLVKLKVREFWSEFTVKKFEKMLREILQTLYDYASHMTVAKGCICVSWVIPDIDTTKLITPEPEDKEFIKAIGVVSLHIGDSVVYDVPGEGCEVMEAAMLQAVELKNARAVEVLLAVGCDPEIATYNGENVVTNIVNIRDSNKSAGSVKHFCIFGHNKNVTAITSDDKDDESDLRDKMQKNLFQENETLRETLGKKEAEIEGLRELVEEQTKGSFNPTIKDSIPLMKAHVIDTVAPEKGPSLKSPVILQHPQPAMLVIGGNLFLSCEASGPGKLEYQWFVDGKALPYSTSQELVMKKVQFKDQGVYACCVKSSNGTTVLSKGAEVILSSAEQFAQVISTVTELSNMKSSKEPPVILQHPAPALLKVGNKLFLICQASGPGDLEYQWFVDGKKLPNGTNPNLVIESVQPSDQGVYMCHVKSSDGSSVMTEGAEVTVHQDVTVWPPGHVVPREYDKESPVILQHPTPTLLKVGNKLFLICQASGPGDLEYQWFVNGKELPNGTSSELVIESVQPSDQGVYVCHVKSSNGNSVLTKGAGVIVHSHLATPEPPESSVLFPEYPVILQHPTHALLEVGNILFLSCQASGPGKLEYQWFVNGRKLPNGPNLVIESVQPSDQGVYVCCVKSSNGSSVLTKGAEVTIHQQHVTTEPPVHRDVTVWPPGHVVPREYDKESPVILQHPTPTWLEVGNKLFLTCQASGPGKLEYQWFVKGREFPYGTNPDLVVESVQLTDQGIYVCHVKSSNGSSVLTKWAEVIVKQDTKPYISPMQPDFHPFPPMELPKPNLPYPLLSPKEGSPQDPHMYTHSPVDISGIVIPQDSPAEGPPPISCPNLIPAPISSPSPLLKMDPIIDEEASGQDYMIGKPCSDKVALLIGNKNYHVKSLRLSTDENDIQDLAGILRSADFKVISLVNLTKREMDDAIEYFTNLLGPNVYALFFYAGHGFELNSMNYMLAVDCTKLKNPSRAVCAQKVLQNMQET